MRIENVDYMEAAASASPKYTKNGGFLTTAGEGRVNTMTVSWWNIGYMWVRPVLTVMVRTSRFSFGLIEKADEFTLTIPDPDLPDQLAAAGSISGRDGDKLAALGLTTMPGRETQVPVLSVPGLHYECRIMLKTAMDTQRMSSEITKYYGSGDYHTFYYGEILASYRTKE